jgi:hypothetical protein
MQRTAFTIAVLVLASTIVSVCQISRGNGVEANNRTKISLRFSPEVAWDARTRFAMHWDDARKKMLFDCEKETTETWYSGGARIGFGSPRTEYDFDVGNVFAVANAGSASDPSDLSRQDGRIHYGMEWGSGEKRPASSSVQLFVGQEVLWGAHNAEGWSRRLWGW